MKGENAAPCLSVVERHAVHSRHPKGGIIILRVHSVLHEVSLFLVGGHLAEGTFNSSCDRSHGGQKSRGGNLCLFFVYTPRFYGSADISHCGVYDDNCDQELECKRKNTEHRSGESEWDRGSTESRRHTQMGATGQRPTQ